MAQEPKVKVQIVLPPSLVAKVEEDAQKQYQTKSAWFEKLVTTYFENLERKGENKGKKIIDLDI